MPKQRLSSGIAEAGLHDPAFWFENYEQKIRRLVVKNVMLVGLFGNVSKFEILLIVFMRASTSFLYVPASYELDNIILAGDNNFREDAVVVFSAKTEFVMLNWHRTRPFKPHSTVGKQ